MIDLLPYLDVDRNEIIDNMHKIHPDMPIFELSATKGEGFKIWIDWIKKMLNVE
ncbi:hypothetical protein GMMP15_750010 [Candidatus Magnetomoraceae bacterium gMMP-15]